MARNDTCAVRGCGNSRRKPKKVLKKNHVGILRWHKPRNERQIKEWQNVLNKGIDYKVSKYTTVCSNHFAAGYSSDICTVPSLYLQGYVNDNLTDTEKTAGSFERSEQNGFKQKPQKNITEIIDVDDESMNLVKHMKSDGAIEHFTISNSSIDVPKIYPNSNSIPMLDEIDCSNAAIMGNKINTVNEINLNVVDDDEQKQNIGDDGLANNDNSRKQKQLILTAYIPIKAFQNAKHLPPISDHDYDNSLSRSQCNNCTALRKTNSQLQHVLHQKNKEIRELQQKLDYIKAMGRLTAERNEDKKT